MDLRVRLTLLLSLIFGATLAVGIAYLLADVRQAVLDELNASSDLATTLLQGMVGAVGQRGQRAPVERTRRRG